MTTHKPTLEVLRQIKQKKQELAELMFTFYMSLEPYDKKYVDLMMDDNEIEDEILPKDEDF